MMFEHTEIISKIGVFTGHFEIRRISDGKKLATAFKKENADFIVHALNWLVESNQNKQWQEFNRRVFTDKNRNV